MKTKNKKKEKMRTKWICIIECIIASIVLQIVFGKTVVWNINFGIPAKVLMHIVLFASTMLICGSCSEFMLELFEDYKTNQNLVYDFVRQVLIGILALISLSELILSSSSGKDVKLTGYIISAATGIGTLLLIFSSKKPEEEL